MAVKNHRQDCASPRHARAYTRLVAPPAGAERGGDAAAMHPAAAAAELLQQLAAGAPRRMGAGAVAALVGAGCVAVGAAAVGIAALAMGALARREPWGTPLLSSHY